MLDVVRLFSPPVPPRFFFLASATSCARHQALRGVFSPSLAFQVLSAQLLHSLHLLTHFNHRI